VCTLRQQKFIPGRFVNFGKRKISSWTAWPWKMRSIICPETTVTNYHSTLRKIPEERISNLHRGGSLKSSQEFPNILKVDEARFFRKRMPRSTFNTVHFPWFCLTHTRLFKIAQLDFNGPTCFHCKLQPSSGSYMCWRLIELYNNSPGLNTGVY
jgi:hypothetical protein